VLKIPLPKIPFKCCLVTSKGLGNFAAKELRNFSFLTSKTTETLCHFECKKPEDLLELAYFGHTFARICIELPLDTFDFTFLSGIKVALDVITENKDSKEILREEYATRIRVFFRERKMPEPLLTFSGAQFTLVVIDGQPPILSIDVFARDFSKRLYKVFLHNAALKAPVAAAALLAVNYTTKDILIDPFCGSGIIPIEAALYARNFPLFFFDKQKLLAQSIFSVDEGLVHLQTLDKKIHDLTGAIYAYDSAMASVRITQKNAKIAGIEKHIMARRVNLDWVDIKLEEKSVDCIVTDPPRLSRNIPEKEFRKIIELLFKQGEIVVSPKGKIAILTMSPDICTEIAATHGFQKHESYSLSQGEETFTLVSFLRNP
jgi:23S rRNA G2445 N2-methylase RlmL